MSKKSNTMTMLGYVLAVFYALTIVAVLRYFTHPSLVMHAVILTLFLGILFAASISIIKFSDWGRRVLVTVNTLLFLYLVALTLIGMNLLHPSYIMACIIIALYFSRDKVRVSFGDGANYDRKSILVVDDDPGLLKTIKPVLLNNGFSVLTATTGEKGIQVAEMQKPDLILLDVILPGIKGREVCGKLKENAVTENIPVIFLTAKDSPDDVKAEIEVGGLSHITKPFNSQELLAEIKNALGV